MYTNEERAAIESALEALTAAGSPNPSSDLFHEICYEAGTTPGEVLDVLHEIADDREEMRRLDD